MMTKRLISYILLLLLIGMVAPSSLHAATPTPGNLGGPCLPGGTNNEGICNGLTVCISGVCRFPDPNSTTDKYWTCKGSDGKARCIMPDSGDPANCVNTPACGGNRCDTTVAASECAAGGIAIPPGPALPATQAQDLGPLIAQVFTWSLEILGIAVFSMIIYAGFLWLTAAGNPGQIGKAKTRIFNALLGAILLLSSYVILKVINPDFIQQSSVLPPIQNIQSANPLQTPELAKNLPKGAECQESSQCASGLICQIASAQNNGSCQPTSTPSP